MDARGGCFRLLAVATAVVLAAAVAEVVLRAVPGSGRGWVSTAHREPYSTRQRTLPNHRSRGGWVAPREKEFRVLVVGDSFTWGDGVEADDSYPYRLWRALAARRTTPPTRVVVWSRPGWNSALEWSSVSTHLDPADADLLIVGYCLNDAEPSDRQQRVRGARATERRQPSGVLSTALYGRSRLYRLLFEKAENLRVRRALVTYYKGLYEQPGWPAAQQALAEMGAAYRAREAATVLVIFPIFDSQLDHRYRYRSLHERVAAAARGMGFEVLDLLGAFEGMDARRLAVEPFADPHPDELAHRIAARRIEEFLDEKGLLPPARRGRRGRAGGAADQ